MLAIATYCKAWRPYIDGQQTVILTKHRPLIQLHTQPLLNKRQIRWLKTLDNTPIQIIWRPSVAAVACATLSGRPLIYHSYSTPSPAISPTATLDTILVEESFLMCLSAA